MHEPFVDHHLSPDAFPRALRIASLVLTLAIVGGLLVEAFTAARIVA